MNQKRKSMITAFLLCTMLMGAVAVALPASAEGSPAGDGFYHGKKDVKDIWTTNSQDGKYRNHRIPGIVVTKKDTVIIYCEARTGDTSHSLKDNGDWCMMDIFIQRSTDGGETFGDPIYIARGNNTYACVNNPVMIVGNDNTLHMLYCKNYSVYGGGLWYRKSTDDGLTWTEERNISKFADSVPHDCFAFGPTHGISTRDGVLMAPVWLVPQGAGREGVTSHGPSKAYVFYSRDNGETWALSDVASGNTGETDIALLSDGGIILNSRSTPRKITTSSNGISGWTSTYADTQLPDPSCCGGLVAVDLPGLPYAHLFTNCASETERDHVTVKCSFDDCVTYEKSLMISEFQGGYSDVAVDSHGRVYVLYEVSFGNRMRMARFSFVDEFLNGDATRTNPTTEFRFDSDAMLTTVSKLNRVKAELNENALRLTATDTRKHSASIDLTGISKNINLTRNRAVVFEMRVNAAGGKDFVLGTYFRSGRVYNGAGENFNRITVPNDGEWHTVIMDLDEVPAVQGMLYGIRLELFYDTLQCEVGDTVDLASLRFFASAEEAREALGIREDNTQTTDPSGSESDPNGEDTGKAPDKKGCRSSASVLPFALLALPAVLFRRKKKQEQ